jgi:hypothetical protein
VQRVNSIEVSIDTSAHDVAFKEVTGTVAAVSDTLQFLGGAEDHDPTTGLLDDWIFQVTVHDVPAELKSTPPL